MKRRNVTLVIGTRPEAIKLAPVVLACQAHRDRVNASVVVTAQHREMLDQVLALFHIRPDVDLNLMREGQGLPDLTAKLLTSLHALWERDTPDVVLVQGDTTSSFVASLAAYYLRIPVGHVEAGLRTQDKYAPFPEEMNRRLVDAMADYRFAPTQVARQNLLREGIPAHRIAVTGNTGIDALLWMREQIRATGFVPSGLNPAILSHSRLILVTAHRRESFGNGFVGICAGLKAIAQARSEVAIVYPVHPNPNVRSPVGKFLNGLPNVYLIEPLDYRSFVSVMERADLILTDSGGIQEEAPSLGKPVLVMREATERVEAVEAGVAELVGTSASRIAERALAMLGRPKQLSAGENPFGDGRAAARIVQALLEGRV